MNTKKIILLGSILLSLLSLAGCDKEGNMEIFDTDFSCLYANLENFHKTAPLIDKHLSSLPKNWSDERKMRALVNWFNSHPCVISAKLEFVGTERDWIITVPPGRYANIALLLNDNGLTRELTLNIFGEHSKPLRAVSYSYLKPREVRVGFKSETTTICDVFDFINLFDRKVLNIFRAGAGRGYLSTLPANHLEDILEVLNAKPYFSEVRGYVLNSRLCIQAANYRFPSAHIDHYIVIDVVMSNMENKDYQADWLNFMSDYSFFEGNTHQAWFMIDFEVPDGQESEWIEKFNTYESVLWATLNQGFRSMEEN